MLPKLASASLVFLILYALMFVYMNFMYFITKRYKWKSRFTILYFHCLIRVVSQACGFTFGMVIWENVNVFVAYLVLSAEGYFSLTIASYYMLKQFEIKNFGFSRLGNNEPKHGWKRAAEIWALTPLWAPFRYWKEDMIMIVDSWLIPANAIIIAGGSLMINANSDSSGVTTDENGRPQPPEPTPSQKKTLNASKGMRGAGQAIFLIITLVWVFLVCVAYRKVIRRRSGKMAHTACHIFFGVSLMLIVRGIFGLLQAVVYELSYYNWNNYDGNGFTDHFVAIETCLAVMPEFVAAALLNATYWPTRPSVVPETIDLESPPAKETGEPGKGYNGGTHSQHGDSRDYQSSKV